MDLPQLQTHTCITSIIILFRWQSQPAESFGLRGGDNMVSCSIFLQYNTVFLSFSTTIVTAYCNISACTLRHGTVRLHRTCTQCMCRTHVSVSHVSVSRATVRRVQYEYQYSSYFWQNSSTAVRLPYYDTRRSTRTIFGTRALPQLIGG